MTMCVFFKPEKGAFVDLEEFFLCVQIPQVNLCAAKDYGNTRTDALYLRVPVTEYAPQRMWADNREANDDDVSPGGKQRNCV